MTDMSKLADIADIYTKQTAHGWTIYVIAPKTSLSPEETAMLQSLYSRSPASIVTHLAEVAEKWAQKFMKSFYSWYGHKSIGDCGNILMAFEWVSMLAAKAIQDSQLYNGQEASTRYIDFSQQAMIVPGDAGEQKAAACSQIQEQRREYYIALLPKIQDHLRTLHPYEDDMAQGEYDRAIAARSFDVARGFLPAGASTCVAWRTTISHANDHLWWLRCHILEEVQDIAQTTLWLLQEIYPWSFSRPAKEIREEYKKKRFLQHYYLEDIEERSVQISLDASLLTAYKEYVLERPQWVELPPMIGECGVIRIDDMIDFGSFRDQQRHRALVQRMWLLTDIHGFHPWYLQQLPEGIKTQAEAFIAKQSEQISALHLTPYQKQYLFPMGMKIPTRMSWPLGKLIYFVELRSQKTVHPTLHANAHYISQRLQHYLSRVFEVEKVPLYVDDEIGVFTIKRGQQTIFKDGKAI